jgi:hypothetical protein
MNNYEFHLDMRFDGKYNCRIYQHGVPGAIVTTDVFDTDEEAIEAAREKIQENQAKIIEADPD